MHVYKHGHAHTPAHTHTHTHTSNSTQHQPPFPPSLPIIGGHCYDAKMTATTANIYGLCSDNFTFAAAKTGGCFEITKITLRPENGFAATKMIANYQQQKQPVA